MILNNRNLNHRIASERFFIMMRDTVLELQVSESVSHDGFHTVEDECLKDMNDYTKEVLRIKNSRIGCAVNHLLYVFLIDTKRLFYYLSLVIAV